MIKVRCICVDSGNKPKEIPGSKWVEKDKEYTMVHIFWHPQQKVQGIELSEVGLDESCFPYVSYNIKRFGIHKDDIEKFMELVKHCTELSDIDVINLVEELNLETI
jgi:hypothetical protein